MTSPHRKFHLSTISTFLLWLFVFIVTGVEAQDHVTLRLADWASLEEIRVDEQTLAAFRKKYPHIDVLYEPTPGVQYEEKILTALATDEPPDVFLLDSKLIPTFTDKKILLDLTPHIAPLNIDTTQWYSNVLNIARRGEALYAFPKGFTPLMMFFNKKLFDDARIPYPHAKWTWDEYLALAKKLTKDLDGDGAPDQYGALFANYYYFWIPWVWSRGGDVVSPNGRSASGFLNTPETESALQFLIDLRLLHRVAPDIGSWVQAQKTGASTALFANNKIAMMLEGHWRLPNLRKLMLEKSMRIGVAPFPSHNGMKVNVMYESGWCVPVSTKHPKEAALLAAFMAGEEACRIRSAGGLEIPSVKKIAEEFAANDTTGIEKMYLDEIPYCRQPWGSIIERFSEIELTLQDAMDEVLLSGRPMHETMTTYAARIDRALEHIRAHESFTFKPIKSHTEILYFLFAIAAISFAGCVLLYLKAKRSERKQTKTAIAFLAPSLLHLVVYLFTPIVFAVYLSFHRWDIVVPDKPFIGLENFREMLSDGAFWDALKNTFIFSLNVPVGLCIALAVALMMHKRIRGIGFLRALYFLPSVTSLVAISLVWMWIYHPSYGAANYFLALLGLPQQQWLNSTQTAMLSIIIFSVWLGIGYQMIIFLAGLQSIPEGYYEAARIDGASGWQRFHKITLPLLKPTTFFLLVTSFIGSFQVFTSVFIMTSGGPVRSTDVIVYHIYQAAWNQLRMGYASAMSWILFLLIMLLTWMQFKVLGKEVDYS